MAYKSEYIDPTRVIKIPEYVPDPVKADFRLDVPGYEPMSIMMKQVR